MPGRVIFQNSEHLKTQLLVESVRLEIERIQEDKLAHRRDAYAPLPVPTVVWQSRG